MRCSKLSSTSSSRRSPTARSSGPPPRAPARPSGTTSADRATRRERHPPDAVGIVVRGARRPPASASRVLPVPPGPVSVSEPRVAVREQLAHARRARARARGTASPGIGRFVRCRRLQRRERLVAELEDPLGRLRSFSRCSPRSRSSPPATSAAVAVRDQHLAAVARGGDPRGAMDVRARRSPLAVTSGSRCGSPIRTRIGPAASAPAPRRGSHDGVRGVGEGDEERVALGVDLDAAVRAERLAQHRDARPARSAYAPPELVQQPRRALDVGEQERDGAARQLAHEAEATPVQR